MDRWLARVRHDLLKPAVWRARDLRELGTTPGDDDRAALRRGLLELRDDEGRPVTASELWRLLRREVERDLAERRGGALADFGRAVDEAEAAVQNLPVAKALAAVLRLEPAFAALARALNPRPPHGGG